MAKLKKMSNTIPKSVNESKEAAEVSKKRKVKKEDVVAFDDEEDEQYIKETLEIQKKKRLHKKH